MGKEVEILCNTIDCYHKTCLKCQPWGFAGVGATEAGPKVRLNWASNPGGCLKGVAKESISAGTRGSRGRQQAGWPGQACLEKLSGDRPGFTHPPPET